MKEPKLTIGDKHFLIKLTRTFGIKKLNIEWSDSKAKWPDIWVELGKVPVITVTREWARQDKDERRKRLVHEYLHIIGMEHDESKGYSTYPERDSYSMRVYRALK